MSLKSFHVVFIAIAMLCALGFSAWTFVGGNDPAIVQQRPIGIVSGVLGVALAVYGVWFVLRKSRRIIV